MNNKTLRVVLIGAGSYVFGPAMLEQALLKHRLTNLDLRLVDVDEELLELMVAAGQRVAEDAHITATISATTNRREALANADFVICAVSFQTLERFARDREIIARYAPTHLVTDFGGVAGISYTLRQAVLLQQIAEDMKTVCPKAWLLSVSNPLPRLCQLTQAMGVNTVGLCSVSLNGYNMVAHLLANQELSYPFTSARERWQLRAAGLNHLSWLLELRDCVTEADLLPQLRESLQKTGLPGQPLTTAVFRETGYLPLAGDDHIRDFCKPYPGVGSLEHTSHGDADARENRLELLRQIASRQESYEPLFIQKSWERPFAVIEALAKKHPETHVLNLVNLGQLPEIPRGVFVEAPCRVSEAGFEPVMLALPNEVIPLTQRTAQVHNLVVQAILTQSKNYLYQSLELDPTVTEKQACIRALEGCLDAHGDILPTYA